MKTAALVSPNGKIFRRYATTRTAAFAKERLPGGGYLRVVSLEVPEWRLHALQGEAIYAGDEAMAKTCAKALAGRPQALATVALALAEAQS